MIVNIDKEEISRIPHQDTYSIVCSRLTEEELNKIKEALNQRIDGDEIHTAAWIPGNDWIGTLYQAIYEKAAMGDYKLAGLMFGLLVWVVFMKREDKWSFGRYEKDNIPIQSVTYFRVKV